MKTLPWKSIFAALFLLLIINWLVGRSAGSPIQTTSTTTGWQAAIHLGQRHLAI